MPGPAPKPVGQRVNAHVAARGEIQWAPSAGWQHGSVPVPPDGLTPAAVEAWSVWMAAWFAAFWTPSDLPGLRQLIRMYDQVELGEFQRAGELRIQMDTYGITPKGQQDRRWRPPKDVVVEAGAARLPGGRYGHLQAAG